MCAVWFRSLAFFAESELSIRFDGEIRGHGRIMHRQRAIALVRSCCRPGTRQYRHCVRPVEEDVESDAKE
jgi:hypothetical protein